MPRIKMYTTRQVAEKFGVHTTTIKAWTKEGKLPCSRTVGGHYRFRNTDVCRLYNQQHQTVLKSQPKTILRKSGVTGNFLESTPPCSVKGKAEKISDVLIEVWSAIENGEVDKKFFDLRAKVRNITM